MPYKSDGVAPPTRHEQSGLLELRARVRADVAWVQETVGAKMSRRARVSCCKWGSEKLAELTHRWETLVCRVSCSAHHSVGHIWGVFAQAAARQECSRVENIANTPGGTFNPETAAPWLPVTIPKTQNNARNSNRLSVSFLSGCFLCDLRALTRHSISIPYIGMLVWRRWEERSLAKAMTAWTRHRDYMVNR